MKKLFLIICLITAWSSMLFSAEKIPTIAIFDFSDVKGKVSEQGKLFSMILFGAVSRYDQIKMVERKELKKIIKERNLQLSGFAGKIPQRIIGQINADYIVSGRIYEAEGDKIVNLRLIRCSDGRIFGKSFFAELESSGYSEKIAGEAAKYIYSVMVKKAAASK